MLYPYKNAVRSFDSKLQLLRNFSLLTSAAPLSISLFTTRSINCSLHWSLHCSLLACSSEHEIEPIDSDSAISHQSQYSQYEHTSALETLKLLIWSPTNFVVAASKYYVTMIHHKNLFNSTTQFFFQNCIVDHFCKTRNKCLGFCLIFFTYFQNARMKLK